MPCFENCSTRNSTSWKPDTSGQLNAALSATQPTRSFWQHWVPAGQHARELSHGTWHKEFNPAWHCRKRCEELRFREDRVHFMWRCHHCGSELQRKSSPLSSMPNQMGSAAVGLTPKTAPRKLARTFFPTFALFGPLPVHREIRHFQKSWISKIMIQSTWLTFHSSHVFGTFNFVSGLRTNLIGLLLSSAHCRKTIQNKKIVQWNGNWSLNKLQQLHWLLFLCWQCCHIRIWTGMWLSFEEACSMCCPQAASVSLRILHPWAVFEMLSAPQAKSPLWSLGCETFKPFLLQKWLTSLIPRQNSQHGLATWCS